MKYRIFAIALALVVLLSGQPVLAQHGSSVQNVPVIAQAFTVAKGEIPPQVQRGVGLYRLTPRTDVAVQGTGWTPEKRSLFSSFIPRGWGTQAKVKAVGYQWVHIPLPLITYNANVAQYIYYVEFCAQSSNGAATKPTRLDVWANGTRIYSGAVTWPADNAYHCSGVFFTPAIWKESLGVSVQIYYANIADLITLDKAWVETVQ